MRRSVLLVGSMPFESDEECMRRALDKVGPYLFSLPDGEVGERTAEFPDGTRACWIIRAFEILQNDPANWHLVKPPVRGANGVPVDYTGLPEIEPVCPPEHVPERVRFDYDVFCKQNMPVLRRLASERGLDGIRFQMGIPTGICFGFAFPNPADRMRYRGAFEDVLAREANEVVRSGRDGVVIQLEAPPEVYMAYEMPEMLEPLSVAPIRDLAAKIDAGARIGVHLCLGDLRNKPLLQPKDVKPLVELSNRLVDTWPEGRILEYIHYPLAAGDVPPPTDPAFYGPLADIHLPKGTHFVAGFVHEGLSFEQNLDILRALEDIRGETVDVACSCGIGRRTPEVADHLLDLMAGLAAA
ncbi:MAG TPA: hypothetical protein VH394_02210 [Thermoanaerobaculia bacterium]|jgi:hypothetical protein|nr:hypothetical protein [Thermoanaerobaculia bacterium]